jgi:hypothetical protein
MPLSLHVARGNARRVAGQKGPAKLPAGISVSRPHNGLGLFTRIRSESGQYEKRVGRSITIPRRLKTTHHRVTDNEKFRL